VSQTPWCSAAHVEDGRRRRKSQRPACRRWGVDGPLQGECYTLGVSFATMSYNQQPQPVGWRARVGSWLQAVDQYQHMYFVDLRTSATQCASDFPKNMLLVILSQIFRSLAVWFVKSAIKDAATQLGVSLSDAEVNVLADVAVNALVA